MEQNLAKLMNEHQSLPEIELNEPVDPFQKKQFGKKMRKSTTSICDEHPHHSSVKDFSSYNPKTAAISQPKITKCKI